ncbi:MAG: transcriptional regulator [Deltaproteobacteria bacterium]|nr:transcriptional regulator [Deltaproteobacteria bacterium]MBW1921582.1 transcriptional regulator [Deltaproteobacteria bacterium]MBW2009774.1 transcriptional regulator [Deltaproteobacteria bacterium]MBW2046512.1 transcriptional regulator [Deltaproteobacteria bacterium]MBW2301830.1 transcriptional regulator [Deltaproteobacteria bacterium]
MIYKYNKPAKTLGPQAARLVTRLYDENRMTFRLKDIERILGLNNANARNFVRKLVGRGVVTRLKPGLFILVPFELGKETEYAGNPLVLARELVNDNDYYLSHGTAMEIHGMVTQPQLVIHVATQKKIRAIRVMGTEFRFIPCKSEWFFGLTHHWVTKQEKVVVSDLERTTIDGLRQPEHCGGLSEVVKGIWMRREAIHVNTLIEYALKVNVGAVIRRLGYIMELYEIGSQADRKILQDHLTDTYVRLDPVLPAEGKYLRKWRLQLNLPADELLSIVRT